MNDAPRTTTSPSQNAPVIEGADPRAPWRRRGSEVAALGGLAVVAALVAGCSASPAAPAAAPSAAAHPGAHAKGVRGTIQAENGSTWTVAARNGKQYTVTLSPSTQYGTKAAPASAAQFPVGTQVTVTGSVSGTTVTASRVAVPRKPAGAGASSATPAPAPA